MARLFVTPREQQFINDIAKEYIKDVVGQYILLYSVSMINTQIDPIYDEAVQKVFEKPIKIDAVVGQNTPENSFSNFGLDRKTKIEVLLQSRDILDKNITVTVGDFFIYGTVFYEIIDVFETNNIFGQEEYQRYITISALSARAGQADIATFRQVLADAKTFKESEVQKTFQQQRGLREISTEGNTGDVRQLRDRLGDEMAPIALGEGPREVLQEENEQASTFEHSTNTLYEDG